MAAAGGALGIVLAPIMVIIKYMTGWAIIPEPGWVGPARRTLGGLRQFAAPPAFWLAWSFVLIFPSGVLASITILPTTPSGGWWWLSVMMVACGYFLATGRQQRLVAA